MTENPQRSVLILNQNTALTWQYAARLRRDGYKVLIATVWETALWMAQTTRPHAIFVAASRGMGNKLHGLARRLRENAATRSIPIILTRPNSGSPENRSDTDTQTGALLSRETQGRARNRQPATAVGASPR